MHHTNKIYLSPKEKCHKQPLYFFRTIQSLFMLTLNRILYFEAEIICFYLFHALCFAYQLVEILVSHLLSSLIFHHQVNQRKGLSMYSTDVENPYSQQIFSYKLDRQNRRVSAGFAIQMLFAYLLSYVNDSVVLDSSNL